MKNFKLYVVVTMIIFIFVNSQRAFAHVDFASSDNNALNSQRMTMLQAVPVQTIQVDDEDRDSPDEIEQCVRLFPWCEAF